MKNYSAAGLNQPPFTKSRQGTTTRSRTATESRRAAGKTLGLSLVGSDPCAHTREPVYTKGSGAQDGVNLGTAVQKIQRVDRSSDGVEPGHTPRSRGRSSCAHAVEFSKTVAPHQKVSPSQGRIRETARLPGSGPTSIALTSRFGRPARTYADPAGQPTKSPARSRSASADDRRSRSARVAAKSRAPAGHQRGARSLTVR